jgi:hypothetical protein
MKKTVSKEQSRPPYRLVIILGVDWEGADREKTILTNPSGELTLQEAQRLHAQALAGGLQNVEIRDALDRKLE